MRRKKGEVGRKVEEKGGETGSRTEIEDRKRRKPSRAEPSGSGRTEIEDGGVFGGGGGWGGQMEMGGGDVSDEEGKVEEGRKEERRRGGVADRSVAHADVE